MKLIMTLLVRDEEDIVESNLAFHLNAGVDFVIATDHGSVDRTTEILQRYAREGHAHVIRDESAGYRQPELVTRMARLAATEFGADWVLNNDADEFWWPRAGGDLKQLLGEIPAEYGSLYAATRHFVPRAVTDAHFAEAMTVRLGQPAMLFDPVSTFRPVAKVMHRASPTVTVGGGNHAVVGPDMLPALRGWYPIEVMHFPWRAPEQVVRKARIQAASQRKMRRPPRGFRADRAPQDVAEWFAETALDEDAVARGISAGTLVIDTRLREALRLLAGVDELALAPDFPISQHAHLLSFPRPSLVDEAAYAVDVAVLTETEVVRAQKRLDSLEKRIARLEGRPGPRISRQVVRIARRAARRARLQ